MEKTTRSVELPGVRKEYKDTFFRRLFSEKETLLDLYNAVNGSQYVNSEELEIVTLDNAVYMNIRNDLAFVLDYSLNLYEHQSTYNPNMPLRNLFYVAKELSLLVDHNMLYRRSLVKIPTPEFLVFYNGREEQPSKKYFRLSDAFQKVTEDPALELAVTVLNINDGKNEELLERCPTLREYMIYVGRIRKYVMEIPIEEAVDRTIQECIQEGILADFLMKNRKEAIEVSIFEYNEELVIADIRKDEFRMGKEEGEERGMAKGEIRLAELTKQLLADQRFEELENALEDAEYRRKLYEEYEIE
ncbi:MAG: hypothetical protein HFI37_08340 [Lachnospiraceae bacterium]|nr:hypothetical protein [Lachnospiraceae bacterium]